MMQLNKMMMIMLFSSLYAFSQGESSKLSLSVQATVVPLIEIITLADIDVGIIAPGDGILKVDPRFDQGAGIMKVEGNENSIVHVSYSPLIEMVNAQSNTTLVVRYALSGGGENNQSASDLFVTNPANVMLSNSGEYYIWIGCEFSLFSLVPGQYDGDFVLEVDYD